MRYNNPLLFLQLYFSYYDINSIPSFLVIIAVKIKQHNVSIIEIISATQKLIPLDNIQGKNKNIGIVGSTYQNVKYACLLIFSIF